MIEQCLLVIYAGIVQPSNDMYSQKSKYRNANEIEECHHAKLLPPEKKGGRGKGWERERERKREREKRGIEREKERFANSKFVKTNMVWVGMCYHMRCTACDQLTPWSAKILVFT